MPAPDAPALLTDLRTAHGEQLIGLTEFAELVGLSESRVAQLRGERNRDPDFPPSLQTNGRAIVHRLADLVDWLSTSRFESDVQVVPAEVWRWRLERSAERVAASRAGQGARELLAGIALARTSQEFSDLWAHGDAPTPADLTDRARTLGPPRSETVRGLRVNPPATSDPQLMVELLTSYTTTKSAASALAHDVGGLWDACSDDGDQASYTVQIDRALRSIADSSGQDHRAGRPMSLVVALLTDASPGDLVFEPTCGECETLVGVALHQRLTGAGPEVLVAGVDRDRQAMRLGRARLSLHGIRSALRLGDSLADGCGISDADRVIADPGALDREALDRWADLVSASLGPTGRAVLVLGVSNLHRGLVETLPPRRIVVVPHGVLAPGAEATALWVVDRADADSPCDVIDLRGATRLYTPDDRLASFLHVVAHSHVTARIESGPLASELDHILPDDPHVTVLAHRELPRHLKALAAGPLLTLEEAEALEDNQRWALQLTRELERLVSPADDASDPYLPGAPTHSPSGVLAPAVSDEARRIVHRLRVSFDPDATTRRGRPRKGASDAR